MSRYTPRRAARSTFAAVRGLRYHVLQWGERGGGADVPLVLLHGWMDVAASFQFVVDAMAGERWVLAPDWRGYGLTPGPAGGDSYWFPDYLGDLDALLPALGIGADVPVDVAAHSMGGNVAMLYAGARPQRVRRLANLEGFGMPASPPERAPERMAQWLDSLAAPASLRPYASLEAVAARLQANNPLLSADKAAWLAPHWAGRRDDDGRFHVRGDPAHKRPNPVPSRRDEALAFWRRIQAPVLWVEGDRTDMAKWWGDRYPRSDFEERLAVVADLRRTVLSPAGHMLHHDQPEQLAAVLDAFFA